MGNNSNQNSSSIQPKQQNNFHDPYSVLGIRRDSTKSEIRRAYQRLALLHHPYRSRQDNEQEKKWRFLVISASYETLMDDVARRRYDNFMSDNKADFLSLKSNGVLNTNEDSCLSSSLLECPKVSLASGSANSFDSSSYYIDYDDNSTIHSTNSMKVTNDEFSNSVALSGYSQKSIPSSPDASTCDNLFGGPLHFMYKARNHAAFTDPYELFDSIFHSNLFQPPSSPRNEIRSKDKELREPFPSSNGSASIIEYENGTRISKKYKIIHGRKIIRTEKTKIVDPIAQIKSTTIDVRWVDSDEDTENVFAEKKEEDCKKKNYSWMCCFNTTYDEDGQHYNKNYGCSNLFCGIGA